MKTIVTISGTSRPDNYTARALNVVNDELRQRGVQVNAFDARELALRFPGEPPTDDAKRLQAAIESSAGVVLATPEYHGTFASMIKLIIENLGFPSRLRGKPVALLGVASGRIGAIKSLEHLRSVCAHVGAITLPFPISVAGVRNVFDADGTCTDANVEQALRGLGASLLDYIRDYVCPKLILEESVRDVGDARSWTGAV